MAESVASYPHKTRLNVLHAPLELIDEKASIVRMAVIQGEYHWHHHTDDDEFFYVVEGRLLIDLDDRTVELPPRQGFVVPRATRHPRPQRIVILRIENAGIIPTRN